MQQIITSVFLLFIAMSCLAQENLPRTYDYDAAGNRILRATVEVDAKSLQSGQSVMSASESTSDRYYEELIGEINVKVFPNPTHGLVTLQFGQPVAGSYYRLSNLAGQLLSEAWITGTTITIDLSAYKTGVYMLTIALNGKTESWKTVKK